MGWGIGTLREAQAGREPDRWPWGGAWFSSDVRGSGCGTAAAGLTSEVMSPQGPLGL